MRIDIPQIFWHGNRDRIMSIDYYPNTNLLITCGAEADTNKMWIKLWEIEENFIPASNNQQKQIQSDQMQIDDPHPINPKFLNEISGAHTATVNIVRFSPNGMYLASGGDDSAIVIWVQKSRPVSFNSTEEKVAWSNYKILRGHLSDVYDLCWSPDSKYLISGSVDNSAIIWNVDKGKGVQKLNDHSHFVQGVSWDPRNKYIATQSSDKSSRFYKNADTKQEIKFYYLNQLKRYEKVDSQNSNNHQSNTNNDSINTNHNEKNPTSSSAIHYYFSDETQCPSFVRRHSWSPDGSICLLVAGINNDSSSEIDYVVWGVSRKDFTKPLFYIPTLATSAVCLRFCPIIFAKSDNENDSPALLDLPFQMVFAIGTIDSVFIYSTRSIKPKYAITNIHCLSITDLAWNGSSTLAISSSDGYITFCSFDKDELGKPIDPENIANEKLKAAYELYKGIDINKNVMSSTMIANVVKPKRKKDKEELSPSKKEETNNNNNENDPMMKIDNQINTNMMLMINNSNNNNNSHNYNNNNSQMEIDNEDILEMNNSKNNNNSNILPNQNASSTLIPNTNNNNSQISSSGKRKIVPTLIMKY